MKIDWKCRRGGTPCPPDKLKMWAGTRPAPTKQIIIYMKGILLWTKL